MGQESNNEVAQRQLENGASAKDSSGGCPCHAAQSITGHGRRHGRRDVQYQQNRDAPCGARGSAERVEPTPQSLSKDQEQTYAHREGTRKSMPVLRPIELVEFLRPHPPPLVELLPWSRFEFGKEEEGRVFSRVFEIPDVFRHAHFSYLWLPHTKNRRLLHDPISRNVTKSALLSTIYL